MLKRTLAWLLTVLMIVGMMPSSVFATEPDPAAEGTDSVEEKVALPEVEVTDIKGSLTNDDPDLTFALNFAIKDADKLTDDYLEALFEQYGGHYVDYVLTISGLSE